MRMMLSDPEGFEPSLPYFTAQETPVFYEAPAVDMGGDPAAEEPEDFEITEEDAEEMLAAADIIEAWSGMTREELRDFFGIV